MSDARSNGPKAYYVERSQRTVTLFLVHAHSAAEAARIAADGGGEAIDSVTDRGTFRRPRRVPEEDRDDA